MAALRSGLVDLLDVDLRVVQVESLFERGRDLRMFFPPLPMTMPGFSALSTIWVPIGVLATSMPP